MTSPNTNLKRALLIAVGAIPEVGEVIDMMIEILWPEGEPEVWEDMRERMENLVKYALDQDALQRLGASLKGIKTNVDEYTSAINEKLPPANIYANYVVVRDLLNQEIPSFQEETHRTILLPLFAQVANLHLALLRDAYLHGSAAMGIGAVELVDIKTKLKAAIASHSDWANECLKKTFNTTSLDSVDSRNSFFTEMTIDVSDYIDLWKYFDPDSPPPDSSIFTREVYSSVFGVPNGVPTVPPSPGDYPIPPKGARVTRLQCCPKVGVNVLEAVVPWYDGKQGPRLGGTTFTWFPFDVFTSDAKHGKVQSLIVNPDGEGIFDLGVNFADGTVMKAGESDVPPIEVPIPADHYLSSVHVVSRFQDFNRGWLYNDLLRTIWFGFCFEPELFSKIQKS